ncbi:unnamed protein product [Allacma fusca]|uniref:Uncharacterized protein n=1 Tax=Allacma fusca TaxID=39272 RepID=A0A8J2NPI7_9HEXA|nr:unnamed protein product [Allacma fusca]
MQQADSKVAKEQSSARVHINSASLYSGTQGTHNRTSPSHHRGPGTIDVHSSDGCLLVSLSRVTVSCQEISQQHYLLWGWSQRWKEGFHVTNGPSSVSILIILMCVQLNTVDGAAWNGSSIGLEDPPS